MRICPAVETCTFMHFILPAGMHAPPAGLVTLMVTAVGAPQLELCWPIPLKQTSALLALVVLPAPSALGCTWVMHGSAPVQVYEAVVA